VPADHPSAEADRQPAKQSEAKIGSWVSTTYFAEGFPYSIVNNLAEILFKELGASLQVIGLTSLFHLPWNLKFLWGPFVDGYETKRRWLLGCEIAIVVLIALIALLAAGATTALWLLALGFLVLGMLSATHDIAIDGYYLEALDTIEQSRWVGFRAASYRLAMLAVGGPLLWVCATIGWFGGLTVATLAMVLLLGYHTLLLPDVEQRKRSWIAMFAPLWSVRGLVLLAAIAGLWALEQFWALGTAAKYEIIDVVDARPALAWLSEKLAGGAWAAVLLLLALLVGLALLPFVRRRLRARRASGGLSDYAANFVSFLDQPRIGVILAFVILFRTGESFLMKMRWPFFDDVIHLPLGQFGVINGTVGVIASFVATIIGGRLIARDGLRRWIWPFVLAQNILNLLYVAIALLPWQWFPSDPNVAGALLQLIESGSGASSGEVAWQGPAIGVQSAVLSSVIVAEAIGSGLGTAVFMVYIMRTCDPGHKAGHMAIVTALMSVSFTIAGVGSGFIAAEIGYTSYFLFTFFATVPSMMLIPFVPYLDGRSSDQEAKR
jgi:PAT family beta-lactamase induction signal transducer AmpG